MLKDDTAADAAVQEKSAAAQPAPASRRLDAKRSKAQPLGRGGGEGSARP